MTLLLLSNNHRKTLKPIYFQSSQKRHSNSAPIQWPLRSMSIEFREKPLIILRQRVFDPPQGEGKQSTHVDQNLNEGET
jgi:hypothetical protein